MHARRLLVATRSPHKLAEIRAVIAHATRLGGGAEVELVDLEQAGVAVDPAEDDVEAFGSFRLNALAKARYFAKRAGMPTIADDSGIVVDALDGAPGVRSRRFAERPDLTGRDLDDANNQVLLERLRGVPPEQRTAHYVCVAALVVPGNLALATVGTCTGRILDAPAGTGGFGYDPLVYLPAFECTFAQLSHQDRHRISHRALAFRALASLLPDVLRA